MANLARDEAVRAALAEGHSTLAIARSTEGTGARASKQRVSQIGRRTRS